jgi:hypothetical protein
VHYDRALEKKALKSSKLYHYNELLTLVLFVLLHEHIGIPMDTVLGAVKDRGRFRYYMLDKRKQYFRDRLESLQI